MAYVICFIVGAVIGILIAAFFGGNAQAAIEKELADIRTAFSTHLNALEGVVKSFESTEATKAKDAIARLRAAFHL
jgi:uncharacterized membrane-anchored protein YhcB (DUF1043 family)